MLGWFFTTRRLTRELRVMGFSEEEAQAIVRAVRAPWLGGCDRDKLRFTLDAERVVSYFRLKRLLRDFTIEAGLIIAAGFSLLAVILRMP